MADQQALPLAEGITRIEGTLHRVRFTNIVVAERPKEVLQLAGGEGQEYKWFNLRYLTGKEGDEEAALGKGFGRTEMARLRDSIRDEGLHHPLICRWIDQDGFRIVQLVNGERRYRNLDFLMRKNEKCFDPAQQKYVNARTLYESVLCQVYDAPDDKTALKLSYQEDKSRVGFGEEVDIKLVMKLRAYGWQDQDILDVTGNKPEWLRDTDKLIAALRDDEQTLRAVCDGLLNRQAAEGLAEIETLQVRHEALAVAVEFASDDAKKKVERLNRSILRAREEGEVAAAKRVEAEFAGDSDAQQAADQAIAAAQQRVAQRTQERDGVQPKVKSKHVRTARQQVTPDQPVVQSLRGPKIKRYYLDVLEQAIKDEGNDPDGQFLAPVQLLKAMRAVVKGVYEGEQEPMKIFRKWGREFSGGK